MKLTSVVLAAVVLAVVIAFAVLSRFLVDLLWFSTLGFRAVVMTVWAAKVSVFVVAFLASAVVLAVNGLIALRSSSRW